MKQLLILIIILFPTISFASEKIINIGIVKARKGLILRENPSQNSKKLSTLQFGSEIEILEQSKNQETIDGINSYWYRVNLWGSTGWSFGGYISLINEVTLPEFYKLIKTNKYVFKQGTDCSCYTESEWWGTLILNPNGIFNYTYDSAGYYKCPDAINSACPYNGMSEISINGNYTINNNCIILTNLSGTEEIQFRGDCCPEKFNTRKLLKLKKIKYIFNLSTCNYKGFKRIMLKYTDSINQDMPLETLTFKLSGSTE